MTHDRFLKKNSFTCLACVLDDDDDDDDEKSYFPCMFGMYTLRWKSFSTLENKDSWFY